VPSINGSVQSLPQLMPLGAERTVPLPLPSLVTASVCAAPTRKLRSIRRNPLAVPPERVSFVTTALLRSNDSASSTDRLGCECFMSAHAPATCGAAMEVPLNAA
jgi:hypothetical protein